MWGVFNNVVSETPLMQGISGLVVTFPRNQAIVPPSFRASTVIPEPILWQALFLNNDFNAHGNWPTKGRHVEAGKGWSVLNGCTLDLWNREGLFLPIPDL